jgi:hypothetical protein
VPTTADETGAMLTASARRSAYSLVQLEHLGYAVDNHAPRRLTGRGFV